MFFYLYILFVTCLEVRKTLVLKLIARIIIIIIHKRVTNNKHKNEIKSAILWLTTNSVGSFDLKYNGYCTALGTLYSMRFN